MKLSNLASSNTATGDPGSFIVERFVSDFRRAIEPAWGDDTVSSNYLDIPWRLKSEGQCAPTAMLLFEAIKQHLPQCDIHIAIGTIATCQPGDPSPRRHLDDGHVWLRWSRKASADIYIIDPTGDQLLPTLPPEFLCNGSIIVMSEAQLLLRAGIAYQVRRIAYEPVNINPDLQPTTLQRTAILKERAASRLSKLNADFRQPPMYLGVF